MNTGKSDVTYNGIKFVLEYVIFDSLAEALAEISRMPAAESKALVKAMIPFEEWGIKALGEINAHVRHRATQGKRQLLRDAFAAHKEKRCATDKDGNTVGCGKKAEDCAGIKSAILLCQEFSRDHIPPAGTRSKGKVTQAVAKDWGLGIAASLPADLLDKVNRGEISIIDAVKMM